MKITCVLLDDDRVVLELLRAYVTMTNMLEVKGAFTDPLKAHAYLLENPVQVLFSDITMPHLNGIDLVKSLHQPPLVVFMTAHPEYAMEGFNLDVIDFLLKPIALDRFLKAVNKVVVLLRGQAGAAELTPAETTLARDSFFIRTDAQFVRLHYREVLYIEALKDFTKIYTTDGRTHLTLVNLKNLEQQLPAGLFIRIHRSYLVNTAHIDSMTSLEMKIAGHTLPLGQTYREQVTEQIISNSLIRRA